MANDELKKLFDNNVQTALNNPTENFWIKLNLQAKDDPVNNNDDKLIFRSLTYEGMRTRLASAQSDERNKNRKYKKEKAKLADRFSGYSIRSIISSNKKSTVDDNGWMLAYLTAKVEAKTKDNA